MPASANLSISEDDLCSYRFRLHINFGLTLCSNGFGVFMILRHSPPEMGPYRWHLMNIIVSWGFFFGVSCKMGTFEFFSIFLKYFPDVYFLISIAAYYLYNKNPF